MCDSLRKLIKILISIAEAAASIEEDQDDQSADSKGDTTDATPSSSASDQRKETTEPIELSSEPSRGLGLLGNRRRLPLRRPGTIL